MTICTKDFGEYPFAHRAHLHRGHCAFLHGHNWRFVITFAGAKDENGFIVDFGGLGELRAGFLAKFDHTIVINSSDPLALDIEKLARKTGVNNVVRVRDCSCEGIAAEVASMAQRFIETHCPTARVVAVTVHENSLNSATFTPL